MSADRQSEIYKNNSEAKSDITEVKNGGRKDKQAKVKDLVNGDTVNENNNEMRLTQADEMDSLNHISKGAVMTKENHQQQDCEENLDPAVEDLSNNTNVDEVENSDTVAADQMVDSDSVYNDASSSENVNNSNCHVTTTSVPQTADLPALQVTRHSQSNHIPTTPLPASAQAEGHMFTSGASQSGNIIYQGTIPQGTTTTIPSAQMGAGAGAFGPNGGSAGPCRPNQPHSGHAHHGTVSPHHFSSSPATPPQSGTSTPNTVPMNNGNQSAGHQHVVHVHINAGETFTVRLEDQIQNIEGPATVRMVSNNGPPLPMPMQVPPGHIVQQIVDENGILTHVILSPQPPNMMPSPMSGGPNNAPQYYPQYGGPYSNHHPPQYPSHPHHTGATPPNPGAPRGAQQHMAGSHPHGTSPPVNCNNHGAVHSQGPSPPLHSMDERTAKQRKRMMKKLRDPERAQDNYYQRGPQRRLKKGPNGVENSKPDSINSGGSPMTEPTELEEERHAIRTQLSKMPPPQVTDIESRSALIQLSPPECDTKEYEIEATEFCYELMLCEKSRDGKYKPVYSGDATEITLKDLKPATEYHLKVCTILDDVQGSTTEAISFKTLQCEPDQPQPPKLQTKSKTSITLKWNSPCENGSKISTYVLESEAGEATGNYVQVYNGLQKQYRISRLNAASKYTFRLAAINTTGKSEYSDPVSYYTNGSAPSQPDPPMLSERYVQELLISWIKRPNDDEFQLTMDDEATGYGFTPLYNGPLLSHRVNKLKRNKEYKFRLSASNDEGQSKWSDTVAYKTLPAKPDPPGKPQIKGKIYPHVFRITWDPPKDDGGTEVSSYIVEIDDGKGYESVFEGTEREHTCDRLIPGHSYRVRVAACSVGGRSEFSEVCMATTQCVPPGQCSAPKLQGKPKATSLHLKWAYPENMGGAQVSEFAAQMILPDNTCREVYKGRDLDCIVAGLSPGRPYLFQVRAFNRAGGGPWSEPLEVVSGAGVPDPPKQPLSMCRSAHSVVISWEGPVNNGATITDFRLEWQLKPEQDFSQLYYGPNTSFEVKGLSPATSYAFRVQAINSAGPGLYSPIITCMTPPSSPSAVMSIRASASATCCQLEWKQPHDNGSEIHAYNIDIVDRQMVTVSADTEYTLDDLTPETTYKVRIQAVNGIGVGAFSSVVKFTTRALPPRPPRLECCGTAHNSLKLKWGEGRNTDLITYTLEMDKEDGNFQEVYRGQAYTCKVNRLGEMCSFDFRIYASNDAGSGPYSETYSFSTTKAPPPALKAPTVKNITLSSCVVEWSTCRDMGDDKILYLLQLQNKDHEYKQIYRGTEKSFSLESLQCKSDYCVRVCAIRQSSDESEIVGAFSPGHTFSTLSPEPLKSVISNVSDTKVSEPKQLTDQQLAAIFVAGLMFVAVLIAFIVQQFISYTSGMSGRDEV